jgi:peroxiredoxin
MSERLHLPYSILSDEKLIFANALKPPAFKVDNMNLIKRITLILSNNKIIKYFYPAFPPDQNVNEVISWIKKR